MLPEFSDYTLILALCLAFIQITVPFIGAWRGQIAWMQLGRFTALGQFLLIGFSFFGLMYAFISNDFTVAYVANHSNSHLPLIYRCCAVWGGHEGSLLLWVLILSLWTLAVAIFSRNLPMEIAARILAILGLVSFGFLSFLLFTSNPFVRLLVNTPVDGQDLNPLLQDPGLIIHPPMLYMGYVGFAVAYAFAIAALISGRFDAVWARWMRPWTLAAWCFLTLGITFGSWWAYRELGWGGWWFWDPVENASFLPWLMGTALIHSLIVIEKRHAFKAWTVLLAICTFSLSLLGTFLVRSGVLISVHSFAQDPTRGDFMLLFLSLIIGGSLLLYAWRAPKLRGISDFSLVSRETFLLANNIFLTVAMATVLLGTLYPLILQALNLGKISVGPPYFNTVFVPLMTPALFFMAMAPQVYWTEMPWQKLLRKMYLPFVSCILFSCLFLWVFTDGIKWPVLLGLALAFWIILMTFKGVIVSSKGKLKKPGFSQSGMLLAHLGMAVIVIGIVCTSAYSIERDVRMQQDDVASVGPYQFKFLGVRGITGANYEGIEAGFRVDQNNHFVTMLAPQARMYVVQQVGLAKTAIDVGVFRDLYVALGEPIDGKNWAVRIYYKPFVRWIWLGGMMILLGGILAMLTFVTNSKKNTN